MSEGRVALVTGAGRGIGRAVAHRLSAEGLRTALLARDRAQLEETAAGCESPTLTLKADVTDADQLENAFTEVETQWGPVEVLVANAGAGHSSRDAHNR